MFCLVLISWYTASSQHQQQQQQKASNTPTRRQREHSSTTPAKSQSQHPKTPVSRPSQQQQQQQSQQQQRQQQVPLLPNMSPQVPLLTNEQINSIFRQQKQQPSFIGQQEKHQQTRFEPPQNLTHHGSPFSKLAQHQQHHNQPQMSGNFVRVLFLFEFDE